MWSLILVFHLVLTDLLLSDSLNKQSVFRLNLFVLSLHFFVGLLGSKLSPLERLPLHLQYHTLIMHSSILVQVMEIHRWANELENYLINYCFVSL